MYSLRRCFYDIIHPVWFGCGALCYMSGSSSHPSNKSNQLTEQKPIGTTAEESQQKTEQQQKQEDEHSEIQYLNL